MIWSITIAIRNCFRNIVVVRRISVNLLHYLSVLALYNCVYFLDNILFYWYSKQEFHTSMKTHIICTYTINVAVTKWNFLSSLSLINLMRRFSEAFCLFVCLFVCLFCTSWSRIFRLYDDAIFEGESLQNVGLRSTPLALGGVFNEPHLQGHGPRDRRYQPKDCQIKSPFTTSKGYWRVTLTRFPISPTFIFHFYHSERKTLQMNPSSIHISRCPSRIEKRSCTAEVKKKARVDKFKNVI